MILESRCPARSVDPIFGKQPSRAEMGFSGIGMEAVGKAYQQARAAYIQSPAIVQRAQQ
jgi:hypothetical protein